MPWNTELYVGQSLKVAARPVDNEGHLVPPWAFSPSWSTATQGDLEPVTTVTIGGSENGRPAASVFALKPGSDTLTFAALPNGYVHSALEEQVALTVLDASKFLFYPYPIGNSAPIAEPLRLVIVDEPPTFDVIAIPATSAGGGDYSSSVTSVTWESASEVGGGTLICQVEQGGLTLNPFQATLTGRSPGTDVVTVRGTNSGSVVFSSTLQVLVVGLVDVDGIELA